MNRIYVTSRLRAIGVCALAGLLLGGCALSEIGKRPKTALYILKADVVSAPGCKRAASVRLVEPDMAPGLETRRIAVFDGALHLDYYTGAAWATPLPEVLQAFMSDAFMRSGQFSGVSTDTDAMSAMIDVLTQVRDFQVTNAAAPSVSMRIDARIVRAQNHALLASVPIEKTIPVSDNHMPSIIAAFNKGMNEAASELIQATAAAAPACVKPPRAGTRAR